MVICDFLLYDIIVIRTYVYHLQYENYICMYYQIPFYNKVVVFVIILEEYKQLFNDSRILHIHTYVHQFSYAMCCILQLKIVANVYIHAPFLAKQMVSCAISIQKNQGCLCTLNKVVYNQQLYNNLVTRLYNILKTCKKVKSSPTMNTDIWL